MNKQKLSKLKKKKRRGYVETQTKDLEIAPHYYFEDYLAFVWLNRD